MNKLHLVGCLSLALIATSCSKEKINANTSNDSIENSRFLHLTTTEYDEITNHLKEDFAPKSNPAAISDESQKVNAPTCAPTDNLVEMDLNTIIIEQKQIINKYPQLTNFTSMLTIYHEALLIRDPAKLRNFASEYDEFLVYIEEVNFVMLAMPKYKAAILSPDGLIQVEQQIMKFEQNSLKIIEDGDRDKIALLDGLTRSTDEITFVQHFADNNGDRIRFSETQVFNHPASNRLQVAMINFNDVNALASNSYVGVEAACFFDGMPNAAAYFYVSTCPVQYEIIGGNRVANGNSFCKESVKTNSVLNAAYRSLGGYANVYNWDVTSNFHVIYANGHSFTGAMFSSLY